MTTLVRPEGPEDDLETLRARVTEQEAILDARATEVDRMTRALDMFAAAYKQQVGTLHEQLDRLELDIAEAELGELSKAVADGGAMPDAPPAPSMASPEPASGRRAALHLGRRAQAVPRRRPDHPSRPRRTTSAPAIGVTP